MRCSSSVGSWSALAAVLLSVVVAGCNDSGRRGSGGGGSDGGGGGECTDVTGTWTIAEHCNAGFVGMSSTASQSGCTFTLGAPFSGFAGTTGGDGSVSLTGNIEGEAITCTGTVSSSSMDLTCNGDCTVRLTRGGL